MRKAIFLMGFMGSGKTTIGKKLARKIKFDFFDLDEVIELSQQKTIAQLFEEIGEERFREIEREALIDIGKNQNCVISLGGGTPCFYNNMDLIKELGTSVYLKLDMPILVGRLRNTKGNRPLLAKLNHKGISKFVREKLIEREPYYSQADFILRSNHPKVGSIMDMLNLA